MNDLAQFVTWLKAKKEPMRGTRKSYSEIKSACFRISGGIIKICYTISIGYITVMEISIYGILGLQSQWELGKPILPHWDAIAR